MFDMSSSLFEAFEDADAGLFMSSTAPLTTTTTTTSTTTTTTTTTTPTPAATTTTSPPTTPPTLVRDPERTDSRLRVRPGRFDPAMMQNLANMGAFGAMGADDADLGLGFPEFNRQPLPATGPSNGGLSLGRGRPGRPVNNPMPELPAAFARNAGGSGYCRSCDGEDAAACELRTPGKLLEKYQAKL